MHLLMKKRILCRPEKRVLELQEIDGETTIILTLQPKPKKLFLFNQS